MMTDTVNPAPPTGTIDITQVVDTMQTTFVMWAVDFAYTAACAVPGFGWLALPIISSIFKAVIRWIVNILTSSALLQAFFINTAVRKASQAQDYVDAVAAKNNLPSTASDEEYENAEKAEMLTFRNFVMVTN